MDSKDGVRPEDYERPDRAKPLRDVYEGDGRLVICADVSGAACSRRMLEDAEHCGDETHVRTVPPGRVLGPPESLPKVRTPRPRIVVNEEFDLLEDIPGPPQDLDADHFDPHRVWVSRWVQNEFTSYHQVSAEEAIEGIRIVLEQAVASGGYRRLPNGDHGFYWRGFTAIVSSNLEAVVRYRTRHYERTPQMVLDRVPSRFRKRQRRGAVRSPEQVEQWLAVVASLHVGMPLAGVVTSIVNFGVFVDIGGGDGLLHVSELSPGEDHRSTFHEGDKVSVWVKAVDPSSGRVSLSLRIVEATPPSGEDS